MVRGYHILVNSVWPEIVICLESRTPSIFAPGDPDEFHQVNSFILCIYQVLRFNVRYELGKITYYNLLHTV